MNILFVCLNNTSISPIAEGILHKLYFEKNLDYKVNSAGFEPYYINNYPEKGALEIASKNSIDLSNHHSRLFQKEDFNHYDKIYAMDTRSYRGAKDLARTTEDLNKIDYFMNVIRPGRNEIIEDPEVIGIDSYPDLFSTLLIGCNCIVDHIQNKNRFDKEQINITFEHLKECAKRIKPFIHKTPVLTSESINELLDCKIFFKCENFQKAGAFKSRGAINAVFSLDESEVLNGVATHSSGNHAQALARAAKLRGIESYIVMPEESSKVKVEAVRSYGGQITFCENNLQSREQNLFYILRDKNASEIHPYNNKNIIIGQATVAKELFEKTGTLDFVLAPVGGGGLLSGTALATKLISPKTSIIGCEPEKANDAYLSFESKKFVPQENPQTIADGLRTSLGSLTFPIILDKVDKIFTVKEETIIQAMRLIWERMKIIIEPSAAVPLATIIENKDYFCGKNIGLIISGGNLDLDKKLW
ncbi:MAG: pyridoxal-phosphate dependent enzyme [Bacteroidales bacterium]